jgi:hypothetical protein
MSSSEAEPVSNDAAVSASPPVTVPLPPEALLDLVQALGGLTSESPSQREFAEALRKAYFDELPKRCEADAMAIGYLREVLIAVASSIRGFAVERTAFRRARAREDKLDELRARITEPKFFHSPFDSERWTKIYGIAAKLLLPIAGTAAIVRGWGQLPSWVVLVGVVAAGVWVFVGDLVLTAVIVRLQLHLYRAAGDPQKDVRTLWSSSLTSYKELALQLLVSTDRARERWFPATEGLIAPLRWKDAPPGRLREFLVMKDPRLGGNSPAEVLSRVVDLHFGVQPGSNALYLASSGAIGSAVAALEPKAPDQADAAATIEERRVSQPPTEGKV